MSDAIVILKGPDTVVASPAALFRLPKMPRLACDCGFRRRAVGFVAGLLAQGMLAFYAASAAVWLHGETGNAGRTPV